MDRPTDVKQRVKPWVVRALGRPVCCEVCGEELFRGLPIVWGGGLKLVGAEDALVRVEWETWNRLAFRHAELDVCRPPR